MPEKLTVTSYNPIGNQNPYRWVWFGCHALAAIFFIVAARMEHLGSVAFWVAVVAAGLNIGFAAKYAA